LAKASRRACHRSRPLSWQHADCPRRILRRARIRHCPKTSAFDGLGQKMEGPFRPPSYDFRAHELRCSIGVPLRVPRVMLPQTGMGAGFLGGSLNKPRPRLTPKVIWSASSPARCPRYARMFVTLMHYWSKIRPAAEPLVDVLPVGKHTV
jgi:hypothetical protein